MILACWFKRESPLYCFLFRTHFSKRRGSLTRSFPGGWFNPAGYTTCDSTMKSTLDKLILEPTTTLLTTTVITTTQTATLHPTAVQLQEGLGVLLLRPQSRGTFFVACSEEIRRTPVHVGVSSQRKTRSSPWGNPTEVETFAHVIVFFWAGGLLKRSKQECLAAVESINTTLSSCSSEYDAAKQAADAVCLNFQFKTVVDAKAVDGTGQGCGGTTLKTMKPP